MLRPLIENLKARLHEWQQPGADEVYYYDVEWTGFNDRKPDDELGFATLLGQGATADSAIREAEEAWKRRERSNHPSDKAAIMRVVGKTFYMQKKVVIWLNGKKLAKPLPIKKGT
jgi:hypothetical protein